jgi:hypothetical protein
MIEDAILFRPITEHQTVADKMEENMYEPAHFADPAIVIDVLTTAIEICLFYSRFNCC